MLKNDKEKSFNDWYLELVESAELMDYSPIQGCMNIRPRAYAVWEKIQEMLNAKMRQAEVSNAYFPLFIPESFLQKESEHFEGFKAEVAWVTHGGSEPLGEKLALRPTSETIMYHMYAKWIQSHRDLPLKLNQWCNVIRWDTKTLKPFLRTREFLWQEGHTAHASREEAERMTLEALSWYRELCEGWLAIPVLMGKKSKNETFPGAEFTTTIEALMPDGKALQAGTSHHLGQNFAKMFSIKFKDENASESFAWQTSWGVSTRLLGAVAMIHSDNKGLVLPPRVAPLQVVILPIAKDQNDRAMVLQAAARMQKKLHLAGITCKVDERWERTPGWKFNDWELKGVPVRLEIGFKELAENGATACRRDNGQKEFVSEDKLDLRVIALLDDIQNNLFARAKLFMEQHTHAVKTYKELRNALEGQKGFVFGPWCGDSRCEEAIKEETGATIRFIPFDDHAAGACLMCEQPSKHTAYFAKSY